MTFNPLIIPVAHNTPSIGWNTPEIISINLSKGFIFSSSSPEASVASPATFTTSA